MVDEINKKPVIGNDKVVFVLSPSSRRVVMVCPDCQVTWIATREGDIRHSIFGPLNCTNPKCTGKGFFRQGIMVGEVPEGDVVDEKTSTKDIQDPPPV